MKNLLFLCLAFTTTFLVGCIKDECTETQTFYQYSAVYYPEAQIRATPTMGDRRELVNPGKMYFYRDYIFINEQAEGVHVYDMSDVTAPLSIGFIDIVGNFDIAIKDGMLYADNVIDMVVLDVRDINNVRFVNRVEGFQERWFNEGLGYYSHQRREEQRAVLDCSDRDFGNGNFWRGDVFFAENDAGPFFDQSGDDGTSSAPSGSGVAGSFARFTILGDFLYTVNQSSLLAWDIANASQPTASSTNNLGWGIETIFPYGDKLFIGSNSGMFIYNTDDPAHPMQLSRFEHARACDPVVVRKDIAYVTLRNGSECEGFVNQLDIIDVSSLTSPKLIKSHDMDNPHGLAVRGDYLYLGEGVHGLKSFDVTDSNDIKLLDHKKDHHVYDVISLNAATLLVVGADGFYIYDSSNPSDLKEISYIPVVKS
jgi:hypothetical protein